MFLRTMAVLALLASLFLAGCSGGGADPAPTSGADSPNPAGGFAARQEIGGVPVRIVALRPGASADAVAGRHGLAPLRRYAHAFHGFAAPAPEGRLQALRSDAEVAWVEDDLPVYALKPPGSPKPSPSPPPPPPPQTVPTGVNRVDADLSATAAIDGVDLRVAVGVAVIDTGVDLDHPDLNARNGATFVRGTKSADDDEGHGTHVAGTIAALDNGVGVVGVAPGAPVWAVKVLSKSGTGFTSDVIAGVDWVAANAAAKGIRVANMSLGGGASQSLDTAVRNAVAAGLTFAVAAGNESTDAAGSSPARVAEAITVSALADSDGAPGGAGPVLTLTSGTTGLVYDFPDDSFARVLDRTGTSRLYSNYGTVVDLVAPGTAILSTARGGGYVTLTGTSMASPHAAGAAALLLQGNPGLAPWQVEATLKDPAHATFDYGYAVPGDDPDGVQEPLLNVRNF